MNRLELWGGVFAAIGGILLALGALNTLLVVISYLFFLLSATMLTIWSIKLKYKGLLIMNITYLICDLTGLYLWIGNI